jgi:hypothetical protein
MMACVMPFQETKETESFQLWKNATNVWLNLNGAMIAYLVGNPSVIRADA